MAAAALPVLPASGGAFAAYGVYVAASEGAPLNQGAFVSYKEKVGVMDTGGPVSVGVLRLKKRDPEFHELERHVVTPEMLVAVEGDVVFPVAPAACPASALDASAVEVFRLRQGEAVIMAPGVWHGLPFPLEEDATLLVVFKEGTPDHDFDLHDLKVARDLVFSVELQ